MQKPWRTACLIAALSAPTPFLAGCGFTPLYAAPGVAAGLPAIAVEAPQGRVAYLLRADLDDQLGRDKSLSPAYRLTFTVTERRDPRGLRVDDVAGRYDLNLVVHYDLTDLASGRIAHSGQVASDVSYDATDAPYAGIAARQDTQERAASDAARRIQIQLAAWLAHQAHG